MTAQRSNMRAVEIFTRTGESLAFRSVMDACRRTGIPRVRFRARLADGLTFDYAGKRWHARYKGEI